MLVLVLFLQGRLSDKLLYIQAVNTKVVFTERTGWG